MRVLILEYFIGSPTADRFINQHRALREFAEVHIVHCGPEPLNIEGVGETIVGSPYPAHDMNTMFKYARDLLIKLPEFDVVYTRNGGPRRQLQDIFISKLAGKPIAIKIGGDGYTCRRHIPLEPMRVLEDDVVDEITLNAFDRIIPLSETMASVASRAGVPQGRISDPVHLGVDKSVDPGPGLDEVVIGYAGRLSEEKDIEFMFKVAETVPDVRFKTVGQIIYKDLEFPDNVHHRGSIPHSRMPEWINGISAGILTSHSEGLPNWVLECYLKARPMLLSDGFLSPDIPLFGWELPKDLKLWRELILSMSPEDLIEEGHKARNYMMRYWPTWRDYGRALSEELYRLL